MKGQDINLCSPDTFHYKLVPGTFIDLTKTSRITLELVHVKGESEAQPNLMVTMRVMEGEILNVKWNYKMVNGKLPKGKSAIFEVPDEFITTNDVKDSKTPLSKYVDVINAPFSINFVQGEDNTVFYSLKEFLLENYLNYVKVQLATPTNDEFKGIFGLGERANANFFFKDGVYSMWSRDQPTPDETGTLPGANMYGTHPFYMYKHANG